MTYCKRLGGGNASEEHTGRMPPIILDLIGILTGIETARGREVPITSLFNRDMMRGGED